MLNLTFRLLYPCFQRHDECAELEPKVCSCGPLRDHILPPWAIYPVIKVQRINTLHKFSMQTLIRCGLFSYHCALSDSCRQFIFHFLKKQTPSSPFVVCLWLTLFIFASVVKKKERANNGCAGTGDDSELNTTPDGQVLQVMFTVWIWGLQRNQVDYFTITLVKSLYSWIGLQSKKSNYQIIPSNI